jgi:hypothetical protein
MDTEKQQEVHTAQERVLESIEQFEESLSVGSQTEVKGESDISEEITRETKKATVPSVVRGAPKGATSSQRQLHAQAADIHREQECSKLSNLGRKHFHLVEFDENEILITEIRKDIVGLAMIYLTGMGVVLALLIAAFIVGKVDVSSFVDGNSSAARSLLVGACFLGSAFSVVGMLIGAFLYKNNSIYVTSEKVAQVLYTSIFNRKVSQLSIGDIQDVTVSQKGVLAHIFNYGTLVIETAGEQQNYTFTFVPEPYDKSNAIIGAHEASVAMYGN